MGRARTSNARGRRSRKPQSKAENCLFVHPGSRGFSAGWSFWSSSSPCDFSPRWGIGPLIESAESILSTSSPSILEPGNGLVFHPGTAGHSGILPHETHFINSWKFGIQFASFCYIHLKADHNSAVCKPLNGNLLSEIWRSIFWVYRYVSVKKYNETLRIFLFW